MQLPERVVEEHFGEALNPSWDVTEIGTGTVMPEPGTLRLAIHPDRARYSNAQIADYTAARFDFRWRPPLRLTVTAWCDCAAGQPRGTAGFGFWNHPFSPDMRRLPRLPQAIWFFFAAPPSNMALAQGVPGWGWKAATLDASRRAVLTLLPLALPTALLMRFPALYATLYPAIQRKFKIGERVLDSSLLNKRHTYVIEWRERGASFAVDGAPVLETPYSPRGACGFVAWIDNQYAVVTPQGRLGFGVVPIEHEQALVLEQIIIERL